MATITETADLPDFFNSTPPLRDGDQFNGTHSAEGDSDWIPVELSSDRSYIIEMEQSYDRPTLSVVDANGSEVTGAFGETSDGILVWLTPDTSGTYYIRASATRFENGADSGTYTVRVSSEIADSINTTETLTLDYSSSPVVAVTGTYQHQDDADFYRVTLETGYTYQLFYNTNDVSTDYGLLDADGDEIRADNEINGADPSKAFTVTQAGTYYVFVTSDINSLRPTEQNDQYRFSLEVEPTFNANTIYTIAPGETITDRANSFNDIDWFRVQLEMGYSYLAVTEAGDLDRLNFFEADGDVLETTSVSSRTGEYIAATPAISGEYFLGTEPGGGAYRVSLITEVAGDVSTASRVALSQTERAAFEFAQDEDVFALDVIEGATYSATLTLDDASPMSVRLTAIDMDGIETTSFSDPDQATLTFTAPTTGTMFVKAAGLGIPDGADSYDLFVTRDAFGDNLISGTPLNDTLNDTAGNDAFVGGAGTDTVVYSAPSTNYTVSLRPNGDVTVFDRDGNGDFDVLVDIEQLTFADTTIDLTNFASASQLSSADMTELAKVYAAYFNRAPDATGLFFWADKLAEGLSIEAIAEFFFDQPETRDLYPNPGDTDAFVTAIYDNVLGRVPDGPGFDFWSAQLSQGNVTQGAFVLEVIRGAQGDDIVYLQNKAEIGVYFSAIGGVSDVADANDVFTQFGPSDVADVAAAVEAADGHIAQSTGQFVFRTSDVVDDPFAIL